MLALAYAARHPDSVSALALVGCGTFDPVSRARLRSTIEERMDENYRRRMDHLNTEFPDPAERMLKLGELGDTLYSYDPVPVEQDGHAEPFDLEAHTQTWDDMVRMQEAGLYPGAFAAIRCPVLMLHGTYDPHPGPLIRDSLLPHLPQLEYREWERCGHSPWLERAVRDEFFLTLREWLSQHLA
jgi:pimeloyl-ACP methyl ester carboxylesterase